MRGTVHSTARRSTSTWRTASEEPGSAEPSSWISSFRSDLSWSTQGADGEKHRPIMIHRVVFGSIERFIGILIEHFAGVFPLWLAPVQVKVLPVNNEYHLDYAKEVTELLKDKGFKVELDAREEKLG